VGKDRLNLNDGPAWEALREGQYVVFLSDCKTDVLLDSEGKQAGDQTTVPVFDNLAEAEECATRAVATTPSVCASIYDHHGRSGDPLRCVYHESVRLRYDPERRARRYTWAGAAFLCAFVIWAMIGRLDDERFLWFYLLGVKLFSVGTILLVRGLSFFLGRRGTKTQ
jgi:hypothetical protein